ncbi:cystathionine gamma-synthase [Protaetiibacter mangrovi]|uniref:Cystathionine gamma-synthase n=1 Tax=Protaetiibacter mangrovi TaxID=2970926 RepID=A0ABT1ZFZ3_9MICO|nr:cystathionine gamma-synthase [Protaetiibacter mangrovi]MCS0499637.1 cystathionine gamma-synthase [Protaetiibacter mangrovi]TPX05311.1 cystathionine gamma-synthase [Schumannella luteola]
MSLDESRDADFATRAIRAGQSFDPTTGSVIPPVYLTTTFVQDGIGGFRGGYEYTRGGNPTRTALETQLAALEGGDRAFSFASGLSAEDALLRALLAPGDHVLMGNDVYGGTHRLVNRVHVPWGVGLDTVEMGELDAVRAALTPETRVVWLETPSNPLMKITDIAAVAELAHANGAIVVVDNTFASPYLQQPLALGADVVVHSTTKYLGGHSDVLGGAVVLNSGLEVRGEDLADRVGFIQFGVGAVSAPMDAWLTSRGIKTLHVRMDRHSANAQAIAESLVGHPKLAKVYYPGLPEHPGHELAARQMRSFGGMLSIELHDADAARRFAESTELFQLAESLGGVESLVCYPSEMTHASVRGTALEVSPAVVRLSVGIEGVDDLMSDVLDTLARV